MFIQRYSQHPGQQHHLITTIVNVFVVLFMVSSCFARRLNNHYLPPGNVVTSVVRNNNNNNHHPFVQTHLDYSDTTGGTNTSSSSVVTSTISSQRGSNNIGNDIVAQRNGKQASLEFSLPKIAESKLIRYVNDVNKGDGNYKYEIEIDNGIFQQESGHFYDTGTEHKQKFVQGSFAYVGPDGKPYTVIYTADADGFHPEGTHLPTPPPIPAEILKSFEKNATVDKMLSNANDGIKNVEKFDFGLLVPIPLSLISEYQNTPNSFFQKKSGYF